MLLVPAMMFFILWPNWGATLYGEIRGASDFKRVFTGMFIGLWITVLLTVVFFLLVAKTFGWVFYQNLNALDYNLTPKFGIWPYPFMFAGWLVHNTAFQVILILVLSLWFFGWVGTLFLSSTRVIFAAAFDRVLPDRAAEVSEKRKVPVYSLILMLLPAAGLSAAYAYSTTFRNYTLDATLVIAVTYLFSAIAVVILPWRKPDLWRASPASRIKLFGIQVVPVAGVITIGLLGFNLYEWLYERQLLREQPRLADLHGRDVRAGHRDLRHRADRAQPPGHRPRPGQQGDPGRVADCMNDIPSRARAVIIGAGIVGNSLAYHLARLGWRDLVLVDKGPMPNPGGSTGHASNFIFPIEYSKMMMELTADSAAQYQALGVHTESGGIEVARTPERMHGAAPGAARRPRPGASRPSSCRPPGWPSWSRTWTSR